MVAVCKVQRWAASPGCRPGHNLPCFAPDGKCRSSRTSCSLASACPASSQKQVDKGVVALPGTDGETETQGIDDLGKR